ncbi:MAG: carboxypeptidase-like regulatory domain-containing protein, partial [Anaerolineae bacterium]
GIDPTGGTDPRSSSVLWSEPDGRDEAWDINQRVAVHAQGSEVTVFIRVASPLEAGPWPYMNLSFLDSAILARTTEVAASSPSESESTSFVVRWSHGDPAPGVTRVKWYDIQWLDEAEGVWHDWLTEVKVRDGKVQETFTGERGHTYRFRARVWQKYENGAHLYSPYRPGGDTLTVVGGPELVGRALTNEGFGAAGATVSISDTGYEATSGAGGYYGIRFLPTTETYSILVQHPFWLSPAPVHGVTFGPAESVTLDWTLRPPDDAVANGEFESGLSGWEAGAGPGAMPTVVAEPVHTGHAALALSGGAGGTITSGITQTVVLTRSWEPALSFWYQPQSTDPDDLFNVTLTSASQTRVLTPSLAGDDWQHVWMYAASANAYFTGTVTIHFRLRDDGDSSASTVYLDEVSLGRTAGGPFRAYLPLALKGY